MILACFMRCVTLFRSNVAICPLIILLMNLTEPFSVYVLQRMYGFAICLSAGITCTLLVSFHPFFQLSKLKIMIFIFGY